MFQVGQKKCCNMGCSPPSITNLGINCNATVHLSKILHSFLWDKVCAQLTNALTCCIYESGGIHMDNLVCKQLLQAACNSHSGSLGHALLKTFISGFSSG
jgi:hypothetical protein